MSLTYGNITGLRMGNLGNGLNFPNVLSTDNYYVNVPHSSSINFNTSDPFSILTWVYFETIPSAPTGGSILINKRQPNVINNGYFIAIRFDNTITFRIGEDNTKQYQIATTDTVNLNQLYHIVATKDNTHNNLKLYINSVSQSITILSNTLSSGDTITSTDDLSIGVFKNNLLLVPLDGKMFNTQIFNKELSQEEITYLYKTEGVIPTSAKSSCVLNLPFNERDGLVVKDYSGQGNNGSLVNYSVAETTKGPNNNWIDGYTFKPLI